MRVKSVRGICVFVFSFFPNQSEGKNKPLQDWVQKNVLNAGDFVMKLPSKRQFQ